MVNAGDSGSGGLVFVDGAGPLLCQRTAFVAVGEGGQRVDRQGCAFCRKVEHRQGGGGGDDGDPVVGAYRGDARLDFGEAMSVLSRVCAEFRRLQSVPVF